MLVFFDESFRRSRSPHRRSFGVLAGIAIPEKDFHRVSTDIFQLKFKHFGHEFASEGEIKGKELLKNRVFQHLEKGIKTASLSLAEDLLEYIAIFVRDLSARVVGRIQITSDAFTPYPALIRKYLLPRLDYAVMQKNYDAPPAAVQASRRYSPAPFIGVTIQVKAGAPRRDRICTSHVERQNLSVRHFNKRFARLGLGWSRKLDNHKAAVALFVAAHNFCKLHSTLGCTPAVGAKLTDHNWTVEELIKAATEIADSVA